ncbi:unnamed protein product [Adineta ricciae]|uniref:Uncharacterized protein n=1 Tax=Adineta ricciae TaxID=249248 RepID=A0A815VSS1_ADIRI|nr:unnamed protein product [Adineta ricciae]CAF1534341.1 unnamed protein product [Adineta ricciae]
MAIEPKLTEEHKTKRENFLNRIGNNFGKEDTMRILLLDEKMLDLDEIYNSQNQRIRVASRDETEILAKDYGTMNHARYMQNVLPIALEYGNKAFEEHWPPISTGLNPVDYCIWDEFAQCVNLEKATSNSTLIDELKRAVNKIRHDAVLQSCPPWTIRLQRVLKNGERYFFLNVVL